MHLTLGILTLGILVDASAADTARKTELKLTSKEVITCKKAREELGAMFTNVPNEPRFKLSSSKWSELARVEYDFDNDKKTDAAIVLKREFQPVFDDKIAMEEALSKPNEPFNRPDKRVPTFLIVWLSNKGAPRVILPKGETFSEATSTFLVDVDMSMAKSGSGILETKESTMMSIGGWSATSTKKKWRMEGEEFRLIGRTEFTIQRNTQESEETDENLLTGESVTKKESLADPEDTSDRPKMKTTTKTKRKSPSTIFLTTDGDCDNTPVTMKAED